MFCVYMILLRDFVPEWNSHPGTRTGVNSHPRDILWWYHVNKYRAMRGNRSELALRWKLPPVSCKHPLTEERVKMVGQWNLLSVDKRRIPQRHVFMVLSSLQTEIFLVKWQFFPEKSFIAERTGGHHDTYFTSKFLWMSAKNFSIDLSPTEFWWSGLTSVEKSCLCLWEDPQLNLTEKEKLLKLMRTNLKRKDNWGKVHNPAFFFLEQWKGSQTNLCCGSLVIETDRLCNHWLKKTLRKKQWYFQTVTVFTTTLTRSFMNTKQ